MELLFELIKLGIGKTKFLHKEFNTNRWEEIFFDAQRHGIAEIVLDGINIVYEQRKSIDFDFQTKMDWIDIAMQTESDNKLHEKSLRTLGKLLRNRGYKMMVLKGSSLAENYPTPAHRPVGDLDIWCFGEEKEVDKYLESKGITIDRSHHHHTVFCFEDTLVENHFDFINVYTRPSGKRVEKKLKELANKDFTEKDGIYYPSADFNALFLLRHCASHFSATEMIIKQALDWAFFMEKHYKDIHWEEYMSYIKKEGMYRFYNLLGLFCMKELGFSAAIFHGLYQDNLYERFKKEIIFPEFSERENGTLLSAMILKPARWWHNRWKNLLCYPDSLLSTFIYGVWGKILKPVHFIQ